MKKIFITGASGCVGHYLFDVLQKQADYQLYLFLRDTSKLRFDPKLFPNVIVVIGEMKNIGLQSNLIKQMDYIIHLAAGWGDTETNYDYTYRLFELVDPNKISKIVYFSTASILGDDGKPYDPIANMDVSYVRSKYLLHKNLPRLKCYGKITTIFPTWVIGGDNLHPYSHAAQTIINLVKWIKLLKFISLDASFHFIHAQDMAKIAVSLLEQDNREAEIILGNEVLSADELINKIAKYFGQKVYFKIPFPIELINLLFGSRMSDWDKYCLTKRHFQYQTKNASDFGIRTDLDTIEGILKNIYLALP